MWNPRNPLTSHEIRLATFSILEMHNSPFLFCNFFQKGLAKNTDTIPPGGEGIKERHKCKAKKGKTVIARYNIPKAEALS